MAEYDLEKEANEQLPDDDEKEPAIVYDENDANLVDAFAATREGKKALREIAMKVCDNVDEAHDATTEYRKQQSADDCIFRGDLPKKDFPYKDAANMHIPSMLENLTRIGFRLFAEAFPDWNNVCGVAALGPDSEEIAQLIALHSNWQLRQQIPDFKREVFRGLMMFVSHGDVPCHSWYYTDQRRNRHQFLTADEFVSPYNYTDTSIDYSNSPYICRFLPKQKHELEQMKGFWFGVDDVIEHRTPSWDDEPSKEMMQAAAEGKGVETTDSSAPYELYWYEGWLKLPNQDRERFCKVILDPVTKGILELSILEFPNWQDQQRFDAQMQELNDYRSQKSFYDQQIAQQQEAMQGLQGQIDQAAPGMTPDQLSIADSQMQEAQQLQVSVEPPVPPAWVKDPEDPLEMPEEPRKDPVHLFTHFVLIEPLVGNLGLGYGTIQADLNRAANTTFNQAVDGATVANCGALLMSDRIRFAEKGNVEIRPGAIIRVTGTAGDDLKQNIMPLEFKGANPQLFDITDKVVQWGQSSAQAPSVLSGDPGKSGETFRGIAARIEQATKQMSVIGRKFIDGLEQVLKNNAFLNSIHLADEEIFHVAVSQGQRQQLQEMKIGRKLYERNYLFEIRADLRFVTQSQRIEEADELFNILKSSPPQVAQNPAMIYQVMAGMFRARGREDLVTALGPPPPNPTMPMPPMMPTPPQGTPGGGGAPNRPQIPGPKPV